MDIVNALASHFSSLPTPRSDTTPKKLTPVDTSFQFTAITEEEVLRVLSGLNETKASGSDGISARLLRLTAPVVAKSLTSLFNASIQLGHFPRAWKEANVTLVPKTGGPAAG